MSRQLHPGKAIILRGDARNLPLADKSVDLVVTSPPYFGLRDYRDGDASLKEQVGAEATPQDYVGALLDCTQEWMRALKPGGSIWVNIGDAYYSGKGAPGRTTSDAKSPARTARRAGGNPLDGPTFGVARKSLVGLPWRYALAAIDELGLILRAEVVWRKPNCLPESVTDRVRRSHEQWFHFTKQPHYFSAVDEIREPYSAPQRVAGKNAFGGRNANHQRTATGPYEGAGTLGALPGSVWEVATQPLIAPRELGIEHYAAFPPALVRRIVLGWSPSGLCTACGEGRRPVVDRPGLLGGDNNPASRDGSRRRSTMDGGRDEWAVRMSKPDRITGYACACTPYEDHPGTPGSRPTEQGRTRAIGNGVRDNPGGGYGNAPRTGPRREYHFDRWTPAPTRPAVVLDPFGGTGTTALVASVLGRTGVSVDLSADYCRLARWRTSDPRERARALGVTPPPPVAPEQGDLFGEEIA